MFRKLSMIVVGVITIAGFQAVTAQETMESIFEDLPGGETSSEEEVKAPEAKFEVEKPAEKAEPEAPAVKAAPEKKKAAMKAEKSEAEANAAAEAEEKEAAEQARKKAEESEKRAKKEKKVKEVNELDQMIDRGRDYFKKGKFDQARVMFETVVSKDPYNKEANEYLRKIADRRNASYEDKTSASRADMLADVEKAWNPPLREALLPREEEEEGKVSEEAQKIEQLRQKLEDIIIPELDFREANIKDVVNFLSDMCQRQGKPVNFILLGLDSAKARSQQGGGDDEDEFGFGGGGGGQQSGGAEDITVTISLRDISVLDALKYITEMAGLKYEVNPNVVTITPVGYVAREKLELRTYDVIPAIGQEMEAQAGDGEDTGGGRGGGGGGFELFGETTGGGGGGGGGTSGAIDVAGFFSGVEFPQGATAVYRPKFNTLTVRNTPQNLDMIEKLIERLTQKAREQLSAQVEIEAKFVEVNEGALSELGFDWTLNDVITAGGGDYQIGSDGTPGDPTDGTPLFSDGLRNSGDPNAQLPQDSPYQDQTGSLVQDFFSTATSDFLISKIDGTQVDVQIRALEQSGAADLLSAPKVTTKSGEEATIKVVIVRRFPMDFDTEEISVSGEGAVQGIPLAYIEPTDYEDKELGYILRVRPDVDTESNTINLELEPLIREYLGEDEPRTVYPAFQDSDPLTVTMPVFRERTVTTQLSVADGSTVVMGGLINESTSSFEDKVPLLGDVPYVGRFFRSEGERSEKKNLLIFVTANRVDAYGYKTQDRQSVEQMTKSMQR
ncbi:hypothetical protein [Kiritimatiella glycovorans]|uniref:Type II and III secretion system protein n=1 Tax=Kiritimatiella glycovorans TaxID=1307763 RepID=A0A0G3EG67_9BACT|nr:hypothetical protein [Kiritimatiella glycovorans]AKJ65451.1 Type II and III secretion system protein [Kiritimatiella glycovorans]